MATRPDAFGTNTPTFLQTELQQREQHEDTLQEKRPEHGHRHALLDRQGKAPDPFSTHLVLVAIVAIFVLNGAAVLLKL